eukprot:SAG11_NODE_568_length_8478_cov_24.289891_5_plen_215_part_00
MAQDEELRRRHVLAVNRTHLLVRLCARGAEGGAWGRVYGSGGPLSRCAVCTAARRCRAAAAASVSTSGTSCANCASVRPPAAAAATTRPERPGIAQKASSAAAGRAPPASPSPASRVLLRLSDGLPGGVQGASKGQRGWRRTSASTPVRARRPPSHDEPAVRRGAQAGSSRGSPERGAAAQACRTARCARSCTSPHSASTAAAVLSSRPCDRCR